MPFKKGEYNSRKGKPNKTTKINQEFWGMILDRQGNRIEEALDKVFAKSPAQYLQIVMDMTEFVMPKLARHEFKTDDGQTLSIPTITINYEPKPGNSEQPS
jgi:hypothetical protein